MDPQDQITDGDHHNVGANQGCCVLLPVHSPERVNSPNFINRSVHPIEYRVGKGVLSSGDMIEVPPRWDDKDQIDDQCQDQL